ncbi:PREDICTED: putative fatty acyl-CoA reductase CG5065 [Nicrophorus vespilloides]|uniref:Fatty acyl-CoA reductase n=1 Tax=Nicrophorus vespilloides TaxID=110193 RepID=A0ABM1NA38_NICVS|nr:PREDICTED: putative fatty acyl-CoA reductase CG5065 [Nicrophorus vespilloides]
MSGKAFVTPDIIYMNELNKFEEVCTEGSDIVNFLKAKTVFLTGATGFLGKALVEKLLRSCEDLDTVFILCREKKGKDIHTRVDEMYNDVFFNRLNQAQPKFRHKIRAIKGDVSFPGLGISEEDRKLITSKTNIILHVAATVRFDEKINLAVDINVKGTKEMLMLGRECKHLQSFVHVSTAFSNCHMYNIEEKLYKPPFRTEEIISLVQSKSDEELEKLTPSLLSQWPNSYAFTKAIAEGTVEEYRDDLPICIFRPAVVVSSYKEPIRGWIDNVYGPTGVITGAGVGILKTLHCNGSSIAEIVPIDYVVNGIISAAYKTAVTKSENLPIYNFVQSRDNPITWQDFCTMNKKYGLHVPVMQAVWYYSLTLNRNKYMHLLYTLFLHFIPALLIDFSCIVVGKKPQFMKVYKKIHKFTKVITYFSMGAWSFKDERTKEMWNNLSNKDKEIFPFDMRSIDWDYHSQMNTMGIRSYLMKEDPSTLPEARKKWMKLFILHNTLKGLFAFVVLRVAYGVLVSLII